MWNRLVHRLAGLEDQEWSWTPVDDERVSIRWRLEHLVGLLTDERNATWLGAHRPAPPLGNPSPTSSATALSVLTEAYASWRGLLSTLTDDELAAPIGSAAGPFGEATRRSFVLHVADELVHHAAEAALLRDLYAARSR